MKGFPSKLFPTLDLLYAYVNNVRMLVYAYIYIYIYICIYCVCACVCLRYCDVRDRWELKDVAHPKKSIQIEVRLGPPHCDCSCGLESASGVDYSSNLKPKKT